MRYDETGLKWPETPEERESIPDYGDFVSTIIWYPVYDPNSASKLIVCRNCGEGIHAHDTDTTYLCSKYDIVEDN